MEPIVAGEPLTVPRSIKNAAPAELRRLAANTDVLTARRASEWYWVTRIGHPLVNGVRTGSFLSRGTLLPKPLSKEEVTRLTAEDLDVLSRSSDVTLQHIAARHPSAPSGVLGRLAKSGNRSVRSAVGRNPSTPAKVLASLERDEVDEGRYRLLWAEVDSVPLDFGTAMEVAQGLHGAELLQKMLERDEEVLRWVKASREFGVTLAGNRRTPARILEELARKGYSDEVRVAAGCNPNMPESGLRAILEHRYSDVRRSVAARAELPETVLLDLDDSAEGREILVLNLESPRHQWSPSRHPYSADALRTLAKSPHLSTRRALAGHSPLPLDILEVLAGDPEESVRRALDDSFWCSFVNDYYSDGYEFEFAWWNRRDITPAELRTLAQSSVPEMRASIASCVGRHGCADLLSGFARDADARVRRRAASQRELPFADLAHLAADEDPTFDTRQRSPSAVG